LASDLKGRLQFRMEAGVQIDCSKGASCSAGGAGLPLAATGENNYFTEMCSGSEAGSCLRQIYHSTLGLRVMKKKKKGRGRHRFPNPKP